jgi:hypothetical protein
LSSEEEYEEQRMSSKQPKTTTTLEALSEKDAFDLQSSSSGELETDSQFNAKYEVLGHALCNWQFEKCYLSNCPAMRC